MFFRGRGNRLEGGAPAAFADFIRVDEVVRGLAALLAFERHGPRHAAHAQSARTRLPLDPLDKFHGYVAIAIGIGFFRWEEEGPGTKQQRHAHDSQDRYDQPQNHRRAPLRLRHLNSYNSTLA